MKICIMRHGEAGYSASSDSSRPLTDYGRQQCLFVADWFKQQNFAFDLAIASPYLRAQQSYQIIAQSVEVKRHETDKLLVPGGDSSQVADYLMTLSQAGIETVFVVSHLPLVGYLVNELCPKISPPMFSTADVACISLSQDGEGTLECFHHPK